jgi:hypothetical protein
VVKNYVCCVAHCDLCGGAARRAVRDRDLFRNAPPPVRPDALGRPRVPLREMRLRLYRRRGRGPFPLFAMRQNERADGVLRNFLMNNKKEGRPYLQHIIGPIVVGIVVLIGQFIINPIIAHKEAQRSELLKAKQEAYLEAVDLVDKFYVSLSWKNSGGQPTNGKIGPKPTREEFNQCLARLLLVEDNVAISDQFIQCFGGSNQIVSPVFRTDLINLMRKDLFESEKLESKSPSPFYFTFDYTDDTGPVKTK